MTDMPDHDQQRDGRPTDGDKHPETPQSQIDIYAEPTYFGYTRSELLARYPQLHDMPPKTRIRRIVQYAWIDRDWEQFMQDVERRHGS
jgi:hypothetical protein